MDRRNLPPLNWLKTFESSARLLSFSKAAEELHLTQAAVSQHVKGLEAKLKAELFVRHARGVELSVAGKAYFPIVKEAIEKLNSATTQLFDNSKKEIVICVNLVFFVHVLAPKLGEFYIEYPNVKLKFTSHIWLADANKSADYIISYGDNFKHGNREYRLTVDNLVPVCSPNLLNGKTTPASLSDLSDHTLIHVIGYKEGWSFFFDQLKESAVHPAGELEFDTLTTSLEIAVQGLGIVLGRTSIVKNLIEEGKLIVPFEASVPTDESFTLIDNRTSTNLSYKSYFKHWLLDLNF